MHLIDVGQGDSILLQTGESNVLVDAGEKNRAGSVVDYLREHGVKRIDLFISTHPHADHIGGAVLVLENFQVKRIIDSGKVHTSQTYIDYLKYIDEKDIPFEVAALQEIKLGADVTLTVIGPIKEYANLNDSSVVAKVAVGSQAILLTGDMEQAAERDLLSTGVSLGAAVLKVGHHGSKTSSSEAFLAAVRPKVALISLGAGNPYNHPAEETLARLKAIGATVYRTDKHGSIKVVFGDLGFHVITERR